MGIWLAPLLSIAGACAGHAHPAFRLTCSSFSPKLWRAFVILPDLQNRNQRIVKRNSPTKGLKKSDIMTGSSMLPYQI